MKSRVFISAAERGITRATLGNDGQWSVAELLADRDVSCLAVDGQNPGIVFAGTQGQGVLRSDDAGQTWRPSGMDGWIIKSLAVNLHNPNIVYAGTKPALMFKSVDGGSSWLELESFRHIPNRWWWFSPAEPPGIRPYVFAIAPSPTDPDLLLAGVEFGAVVRSEDGGQSWSRHRRGALRDCHSLKFHTVDGDWAYEAGGGGASISRNGGITWQKAKRGLAKSYGIVCAADPGKPEIWYVCTGSSPFNAFGKDPAVYLYRSTGGAGWQPIGWMSHPLTATPTALVTLPDSPGHLYAGLKNGDVWHTADYGDNWDKMPFNLGTIWFSMIILEGG